MATGAVAARVTTMAHSEREREREVAARREADLRVANRMTLSRSWSQDARRMTFTRSFTRSTLVMPSQLQLAVGSVLAKVQAKRSRVGQQFLILDPTSSRLQAFEAFCLVVTMVTAFTTPFEMAFVPRVVPPLRENGFFVANRVIDGVFFVDFWLKLLCVPYKSGRRGNHYVKERHLIALHYAKTWLLPDLVALFPFDLLTYRGVGFAVSGHLVTILRLLRLIRLLKLGRVMKIVEKWSEASSVPYAYIEIGKLMSFIFMTVHWVACAWGLIGEIQDGHAFYWLDSLKANMASTCSAQASHDKVAARLERLDDLEMGPVGPVTKGQGPLTLGLKHVRARF